jgi:hypothetical protein
VTVKSSVARYEGTGLRFTATTGSGHRYRILRAGSAVPIEGAVLVTGPGADVDHMGRRPVSGSVA